MEEQKVSKICIKKASMTSVIHTYTQIHPRKRLRIIIPGADKANRSYHTWLVAEYKMVILTTFLKGDLTITYYPLT